MDTSPKTTERSCIGPEPHASIVQLQVAPRINHRIRFSALGTTKPTHILPQAAVKMVSDLRSKGAASDSVLIYGPGDPLADIELSLESILAIKENFPEINVIVRTLGIGGLQYADKLRKAGVTEVELLIDGMDPMVLENLYAWIRPGFKTLKLSEAAEILHIEQTQSIQAFKDAGMFVRIVSTLYPTANDDHLLVMAKKVAELGADELILHPYSPEPEADIVLPEPEQKDVLSLIDELSEILPSRQGRPASTATPELTTSILPKPDKNRPNIAVVSSNGMDVDLHLGQAPQLLVYGPRDDGLNCLLECRPAPASSAGKDRWEILASSIPDCFALLTASAGERPRRILDGHGIQVVITQDNINGTVDQLYGGGKKSRGMHSKSS
ncbi:NifB/NifX family molybdenum-iron cluster-binding protein [Desulfosediminicola flagellatus]|uniref:NifB/NifX family molybdenum-iron cluster-binding protein n=1 Tax=Desulfosediminicola flagellatus TaxID=2569541 RepID=UPI0010AC979B|nr:NifB/NifX family molybdenum-iron cluster-binding protein [Desulfosediminicola flagellatus]